MENPEQPSERIARFVYRSAAADILVAARDMLQAAQRITKAAEAFADAPEDAGVMAMAESARDALVLACHAPGIRQMFAEAVAASAPPEPIKVQPNGIIDAIMQRAAEAG